MCFDCDWLSPRILLAIGLCALAATPAGASSRKVDLGDLANRLVADASKSDSKSLAVADFLDPKGGKSDLGIYLAEKLSDAVQEACPKSFRFLERADMGSTKITALDVTSPDLLRRIGFNWGVAAIVTGVVEIERQQYRIRTELRRTADGSLLATESQAVPRSRVLDLLSPSGIDAEAADPKSAGTAGASVPICTYCPIASNSKTPRVANASAILQVTISPQGQAIKMGVLKDPGYGLIGQAIESVSDWKFKPALNKDGTPIVVIVPVVVTFNTSRAPNNQESGVALGQPSN